MVRATTVHAILNAASVKGRLIYCDTFIEEPAGRERSQVTDLRAASENCAQVLWDWLLKRVGLREGGTESGSEEDGKR